jgi:phosphatidate phosphatase APP1
MLIVVLLIGFAAAGRSAENSERVSGRVTEAFTNVAVPDASVSLTINAKGNFSTQTDREGYYTFEHLPAGVGSISVTKVGFGI